jgi:hypothetical protein
MACATIFRHIVFVEAATEKLSAALEEFYIII